MSVLFKISQKSPMSYGEVPDVRLADMADMGDEKARRELLVRVLPRVRKTVAWLCRHGDEWEDIVQLALVQILRSSGTFRGDSTLSYWADRVTVLTAARVFEKRDRRKRLADTVWQPGPEVPSVEKQAELSMMKDRLREHLRALPEKQRIPVVLHYLHGYQVSEIAEMTSVKVNTVRGRLRKGLKTIRRQMSEDPRMTDWIQKRER